MFLERFVTSSVRNQLLAGFLGVIVVFAVALAISVSGISSVSTTVRHGYTSAKLADEVTQQTAASTEQISASAQSLAGTAEHLDELVGQFTLAVR